jgi:DNA-binding beta-propeller fold protein YncE
MNRSFWPVRKPAGFRMVTLLTAVGCAAISLAGQAVPAAAAGHAAARHGQVHATPSAASSRPARAAAHAAVRTSRHSFPVPGGPVTLASNPRTKTLYVLTLNKTIALVSTARCNRFVRSGCRVRAWIPGRAGFQDVTVDRFTNTIYALFGGTTGKGHTLEVINGARCNVTNHADCRPVARIRVGRFPIGETLDRSANTIYVSNNYSNTVSLVSTTRCNGTDTSGCRPHPRAVRVGPGPNLSDLVRARHTLYVPNNGPGGSGGNTGEGGTTVSLINTATCNAHRHSGCHSPARTATVGTTPFGVTAANGTVYAWNGDSTASMINAATCNAVKRVSCHHAKPTATIGVDPGPGDFNRRTHTVFTVDSGDDTVSALNARTCNARRQSGCEPVARTLTTGGLPAAVLADPATNTLYVPNLVDNTVSVLNGGACDASHRAGCRRLAPSVPQAEFLLSVDPATNTIYGGNNTQPRIDVFNGATCRAGHLAGCTPVATIATPNPFANVGAIDRATNTLYASDEAKAGTVMVINIAACNAQHTSGCSAKPHSIKIGGAFPNAPVLNPATKTLYVSYGLTGNHIAVINAATCNATNAGGCGQKPAVINVQNGTFNLGVSVKTNTVYGTNTFGTNTDTVTVINGARCNGTNHAGCGHVAAIAKVGLFPQGIAVNDRIHTVYITNNGNGDVPGSVSVLNSATCNGMHTAGCHRRIPTVATGRAPTQIALDTRTGNVYLATFNSASVTIIKGSRCNAAVPSCRHATRSQPVGSRMSRPS